MTIKNRLKLTLTVAMIASGLLLFTSGSVHARTVNAHCSWHGCDIYLSKRATQHIYNEHKEKVRAGPAMAGAIIGLIGSLPGSALGGLAGGLAGSIVVESLKTATRKSECFRIRTAPGGAQIYWIGAGGGRHCHSR